MQTGKWFIDIGRFNNNVKIKFKLEIGHIRKI